MEKSADHHPKNDIPEAAAFSWPRMLRLSTFQIGSAMGDILVTSIWNRVMISNFGMPAWPIGMLIALRYFMSPLSLWAGHRSDTTKLFGFYRTSYIWFGRGLMVIAFPFLFLSLQRLDGQTSDPQGWLYAILCFALYGVGTLLSGSPFLALVRDSAPKVNQGFAISVAETVLIIFFAISGISFSYWMEAYDPTVFRQMVIFTMLVGGFFWWVGIVGIEKQSIPPAVKDQMMQHIPPIQFAPTLKKIWSDSRTRLFFFFLATATLSAWMQDVILEPFGADVLEKSMRQTTRYNSYWQTATVVTLIGGAAYWRKRPPEAQKGIAGWGLLGMALGMGLLSLESFLGGVHLIEIALFVFGAGFGIYTFGGLSLMAVMSSDKASGAYLGLWTIAILIFKGLGNFIGSVLRDLSLGIGFSATIAYGITFLLAAVGLACAVLILSRIDIRGFARDYGRYKPSATEVQAAGVEL